MNTTTDGKASAVLSEYVMVIFKGGLGSWLPYCSLEGRGNSLSVVTPYWPWLTGTCLSGFHQHRRYWLAEILPMHTGPHGICMQFYPRNFQVFTYLIATSELLHTLTSFRGHLVKYGTLIATITNILNCKNIHSWSQLEQENSIKLFLLLQTVSLLY